MTKISRVSIAIILATFTSASFAKAETATKGGQTTTALSNVETATAVTDAEPIVSTNWFMSDITGPTLAPSKGRFETLLGLSTGKFRNLNFDSSTVSEQQLQVAYGFGPGLYASLKADQRNLKFAAPSFSMQETGFGEPQLALGYARNLSSNEKIKAQVAYTINSGAKSESISSTPNFSNTSIAGDTIRGGSAWTPAVQFETKSIPGVTAGARLSYFMPDKTQTNAEMAVPGVGTQFVGGQTVNGGNETTLAIFAQRSLTDNVAVGAMLADFWQESFTTSSAGGNQDQSGMTTGLATVYAPVKVNSTFSVVPEINYLKTLSDGGKTENYDVAVNALYFY